MNDFYDNVTACECWAWSIQHCTR